MTRSECSGHEYVGTGWRSCGAGIYRFRDMVLSKKDLLKIISDSGDAEASCSTIG